MRADSEADPYQSESKLKTVSREKVVGIRCEKRELTMMMPPPTLPSFIHPSLNPKSFATQSITTDSNSVQAGEQSQLNPGFETAPVYMSARIDSYVVLAGK